MNKNIDVDKELLSMMIDKALDNRDFDQVKKLLEQGVTTAEEAHYQDETETVVSYVGEAEGVGSEFPLKGYKGKYFICIDEQKSKFGESHYRMNIVFNFGGFNYSVDSMDSFNWSFNPYNLAFDAKEKIGHLLQGEIKWKKKLWDTKNYKVVSDVDFEGF